MLKDDDNSGRSNQVGRKLITSAVPLSPKRLTAPRPLATSNEIDPIKCIELCSKGIYLNRVKGHRIRSAKPISIRDQKWLCYHSKSFWNLLPHKLKSGDFPFHFI
ncbi:unnamed protein product [Dracunculus medinensis]|uniref:Uncharacterized protein n=1 Tax=Dracunculus medinensis TaxID=318479 RepID=A0A0N4UIW5_DRAME|nr:unnamed protein product [Dracunculus medinensis]